MKSLMPEVLELSSKVPEAVSYNLGRAMARAVADVSVSLKSVAKLYNFGRAGL